MEGNPEVGHHQGYDPGPIVGVLPLPAVEVYVSPLGWYGGPGANVTPVLLVGCVVYANGSTESVILDDGSTQVLGGDAYTVDDVTKIEGYLEWRAVQRRAS